MCRLLPQIVQPATAALACGCTRPANKELAVGICDILLFVLRMDPRVSD